MDAARISEQSDHDFFNSYIADQVTQRQLISDIKHEIHDLRKDMKHQLSELKLSQESDLKSDLKDLEMRMYHFISKTAITAIGVLGGLQSFFHFLG